MGDVKLLPCPICGNTAVEPRRFDGEWSLVCADNRHMCEVTGMDRSDVIAAWNDRPALTPAQQAAEEMAKALEECLKDTFTASEGMSECGNPYPKKRYRAGTAALDAWNALAKAGKP